MRFFLTLFFVAALCGGTLSAQAFGIRAGVNSTNLKVGSDGVSFSFGSQTNLMLGLFADLPLGGEKFTLSPELNYVGRGYDSDLDFLGTAIDMKVNFAYLDLGLLAKFLLVDKESVGVYVAAGPVFSYAMSGSVESGDDKEDVNFDEDDGFNRTNLNLAATAGLTFGQKFFVEGRYMAGLSSVIEDEDDEATSKWTSIGLNGGIRIPIGN